MKNVLVVHAQKSTKSGEMHPEFIRRLDKAISLNKDIAFDSVIISGGQTRKYAPTEAEQGENYLQGKLNATIILENQSRSTSENIQQVKNIIQERFIQDDLSKIYIITSKKIAFRIKYLYSRIYPEIKNIAVYVFVDDSYPLFSYFMEYLYLLYAFIDPYEKTLAQTAKKIFRNA